MESAVAVAVIASEKMFEIQNRLCPLTLTA